VRDAELGVLRRFHVLPLRWKARPVASRSPACHAQGRRPPALTRTGRLPEPGRRHVRAFRGHDGLHKSACRTMPNVSRIARWSVLRTCCIPGSRWSWRCGAAVPRCPPCRISQYETSKPLCDRLKYPRHARYRAVDAHDGGNAGDLMNRPNKRAPTRRSVRGTQCAGRLFGAHRTGNLARRRAGARARDQRSGSAGSGRRPIAYPDRPG
jgi:hypothetical protein